MEGSAMESAVVKLMVLQMPMAPVVVMLYAALFALVCASDKEKQQEREQQQHGGGGSGSGGSRACKLPRKATSWKLLHSRARRMDEASRNRQWRRRYRVSFPVFTLLVEELRPFLQQAQQQAVAAGECAPVEVERAVAMVLHRLAHGLAPAAVAELYAVSSAAVACYTLVVTHALASRGKLYSRYVQAPAGRRLRRIALGFQAVTGLPNVCGAIDGTHVRLSQIPSSDSSPPRYWTQHGFYSVLLQGVCDADCVFWDVCCNGPGGLGDAAHLRSSRLWSKLMEGGELAEPLEVVDGREVRPYLVGDSAYPLLPFLITPFAGGSPGREDQGNSVCHLNAFDAQLSKGRERIGAAFGMLKSRWRIMRNMDVGLEYAAQTAVACCVLHNFCQLHGEPVPGRDPVDPHPNLHMEDWIPVPEDERYLASFGEDTRLALYRDWLGRRGSEEEEEDDEEEEEEEGGEQEQGDDGEGEGGTMEQPEHEVNNIFRFMREFCVRSGHV